MPKTSFCFSLSDHYDDYKKYRVKYGGKKITEVQHSKIINTFLELALNKVIKDLYIFNLPFGLGSFRIVEYDLNSLPPYYQRDKLILASDHTLGKGFTIKWDKRSSRLMHKRLRSFSRSAKGHRMLKAHIKSNPNKIYTAYKK